MLVARWSKPYEGGSYYGASPKDTSLIYAMLTTSYLSLENTCTADATAHSPYDSSSAKPIIADLWHTGSRMQNSRQTVLRAAACRNQREGGLLTDAVMSLPSDAFCTFMDRYPAMKHQETQSLFDFKGIKPLVPVVDSVVLNVLIDIQRMSMFMLK
jgi:hypothetical protein